MKLTERRMRVLLKIQESPWRLFENDRDAALLAGAGLIVATERWSNGTVLFCITTSGRKLLRKAILKRLEDGRDHLLNRAECISARGLKKAGLVEYLGLNHYRITPAGRDALDKERG
ncbi:hypothetical protein [Shinella sp. BYT-45]|uniref:hypothetical protein n=1 Tax=Shinella sp. BYT-45 TaxID=3377377 RepID=UPI00397EBD1D